MPLEKPTSPGLTRKMVRKIRRLRKEKEELDLKISNLIDDLSQMNVNGSVENEGNSNVSSVQIEGNSIVRGDYEEINEEDLPFAMMSPALNENSEDNDLAPVINLLNEKGENSNYPIAERKAHDYNGSQQIAERKARDDNGSQQSTERKALDDVDGSQLNTECKAHDRSIVSQEGSQSIIRLEEEVVLEVLYHLFCSSIRTIL